MHRWQPGKAKLFSVYNKNIWWNTRRKKQTISTKSLRKHERNIEIFRIAVYFFHIMFKSNSSPYLFSIFYSVRSLWPFLKPWLSLIIRKYVHTTTINPFLHCLKPWISSVRKYVHTTTIKPRYVISRYAEELSTRKLTSKHTLSHQPSLHALATMCVHLYSVYALCIHRHAMQYVLRTHYECGDITLSCMAFPHCIIDIFFFATYYQYWSWAKSVPWNDSADSTFLTAEFGFLDGLKCR